MNKLWSLQLTDSLSSNSGSSTPRIRPRVRPRIRPRLRPSSRIWNYRRLGTYRVPRGRSSPGRRYLGTVKPRINPTKQCAIMARKKRYRFFGVRSRRYCYGASTRIPLTRFGRTTGLSGMSVYKIGRGKLRYRSFTCGYFLHVMQSGPNWFLLNSPLLRAP